MIDKENMNSNVSRRKFLTGLGLLVGGTVASSAYANNLINLLSKSKFNWGYAAITWSGNDTQAIKDISSLGFKGIQLRGNTYKEYAQKPSELKALLKQHHIKMPVFSSGSPGLDPAEKEAIIKKHVDHAKFIKAVGGKYLQVTAPNRSKDGAPTPEDLRMFGLLISEIGKQTSDLGVTVVFHNHMHQMGEKPEEIDMILQSSDEKYVKFLLDIAHYFQGGGNPVEAIKKYTNRISVVHMKDVKSLAGSDVNDPSKSYKFVELGEGKVDIQGVAAALNSINFKGWAIVELDQVPEINRTPLESAKISKKFINEQLKLKV